MHACSNTVHTTGVWIFEYNDYSDIRSVIVTLKKIEKYYDLTSQTHKLQKKLIKSNTLIKITNLNYII